MNHRTMKQYNVHMLPTAYYHLRNPAITHSNVTSSLATDTVVTCSLNCVRAVHVSLSLVRLMRPFLSHVYMYNATDFGQNLVSLKNLGNILFKTFGGFWTIPDPSPVSVCSKKSP